MRMVWGFFWVFAHAQYVYVEIRSYKCGGPGEYFGGLRMSLWSHSRDCAGQNHFGELHMRTNSMHVGPHMNAKGLGSSWGCCFLIGRNGSSEQIVDVSHANESRHPQNNTRIVFLALWFVTSYMSHMYYILAIFISIMVLHTSKKTERNHFSLATSTWRS